MVEGRGYGKGNKEKARLLVLAVIRILESYIPKGTLIDVYGVLSSRFGRLRPTIGNGKRRQRPA